MKHLFVLLCAVIGFVSTPLLAQESSCESGRAFLGVTTDEVGSTKAELLDLPTKHGAYITKVYPGLAADEAGLEPFDYIVRVGDERLNGSQDLTDVLGAYRPGEAVEIEYLRRGETRTTTATLGDRQNYSVAWDYNKGRAFLGVSEHHDEEEDEMGVAVHITNGGSAQAMGLKGGDVIMAINDQPIADWDDISIAVNNMAPGDPITIDYVRVEQPNRVSGQIGGEADRHRAHMPRERGYLGIYSDDMDTAKARLLGFETDNGSYINKVVPNSAAAAAGLQVFDYIVGIDDYRVADDMRLTHILNKYQPGEEVTVHFIRKNEPMTVKATLGREADGHAMTRPCTARPFFGVRPNEEVSAERGVGIDVVNNSSAAAAGLKDGDLVMAINDFCIIDWGDLSTAINAMNVGETITVGVMREGRYQTLSGPIGSECDESGDERDWDFDFNFENGEESTFEGGDERDDAAPLDRPVDMERIRVSMEDMDEGEADAMRERGVDMPLVNNLSIEALTIYPNPNRGMFRLEFELPGRGETGIRVFNSEARLIYSFDLGEFTGEFTDEIDISQNGPGAYFLEVRQGDASMVKKVLLQY